MQAAPSSGDSDSEIREIREIQALLDRRMRLRRFRPVLERGFLEHTRLRALELIRSSVLVTIVSFVLLGVVTWVQLHRASSPALLQANMAVWWWAYPAEAVVVLALMLVPRLPFMERRFRLYVSLIAGLAVSLVTVAASAFPEPYFNIYTSYVVILVTLIVYGAGGLTLRNSALVCTLAGLLALAIIRVQGYWLDPAYFSVYVVLANAVGMLLGYLLELRDRVMFLQSHLLQLEKSRLDAYAREVARLSREDVLTGLANRRHFNETLLGEWDRARRHQQPLSLIFVDIDHFKPFNDTHGHVEGDRVLAAVGQALAGVLRRPADLAARYGGEEFVLLLPNTVATGAAEVATQVRAAVAALAIPHLASRVADHVTASVGVASVVPSAATTSAQLVRRADEAAYAAKAAGRNRVMLAD
jgi:diguanylate cyclase (GGDEF)-like protein